MTTFIDTLLFLLGIGLLLVGLASCLIGGYAMEAPAMLKLKWGKTRAALFLIFGCAIVGCVGGTLERTLRMLIWQEQTQTIYGPRIFLTGITIAVITFGAYVGRDPKQGHAE